MLFPLCPPYAHFIRPYGHFGSKGKFSLTAPHQLTTSDSLCTQVVLGLFFFRALKQLELYIYVSD